MRISAKKTPKSSHRICQGDIFTKIDIMESFIVKGSKIEIEKISFPYVICLNQECDLENDYNSESNNDSRLIHIAIAPAFNFQDFLTGTHWANVYETKKPIRRKDTKTELIIANEIPRYHYLKFPENDLPELIVDFKHFFTINRNILYEQFENRLCSLEDLFKEKFSQRFSHFISRIGLPE